MRKTETYKLNQWDAQDRVLMEDFNWDNANLESALAGLDGRITEQVAALGARVAALETAAGAFGNCRLEVFTYKGTGNAGINNPTRITFSKKPTMFIVQGQQAIFVGTGTGEGTVAASTDSANSDSVIRIPVTWNGTQANFYDGSSYRQMNVEDKPYVVCAFYAADPA